MFHGEAKRHFGGLAPEPMPDPVTVVRVSASDCVPKVCEHDIS